MGVRLRRKSSAMVSILLILFLAWQLPGAEETERRGAHWDDNGDSIQGLSTEDLEAKLFNIDGRFIENKGQLGAGGGEYYILGNQLSVAFGRGWVAYDFKDPDDPSKGALVRVEFEGADIARPEGRVPSRQTAHYLIGNDPEGWISGTRSFDEIWYAHLWKDIDLRFYIKDGLLKYDFIIAPGGDPDAIGLRYEGIESIGVDTKSGDLMIRTSVGTIRDQAPRAYQVASGSRIEVGVGFLPTCGNLVKFATSEFDTRIPLVLDPGLQFSTYLGGPGGDTVNGLAIDGAGAVYTTGETGSPDFPTSPGGYIIDDPGEWNAFVMKLNPEGSEIIYSTYIGGRHTDEAFDIWVDDNGHAYVTGHTASLDFPTTEGAFCTTVTERIEPYDMFVLKLEKDGSSLVYSTIIPGEGDDRGVSIWVSSAGEAYVAGSTTSDDFPTTPGAFQEAQSPADSDSEDAFVLKINADGSSLIYSTLMGGVHQDYIGSLDVDSGGYIYLSGATNSTDFPTTEGAHDTSIGGEYDAFVVKLNPQMSKLIWSTYIGGEKEEFSPVLTVDESGCVYVTGLTFSTEFPTTARAFSKTLSGDNDLFITKLSSNGASPLFSTYVGGSKSEKSFDIELDRESNVYVTGYTHSQEFPVTPTAVNATLKNSQDGFLLVMDPTLSFVQYGTFFGGSRYDAGMTLALDGSWNAIIGGFTDGQDFPTTEGALAETPRGGTDGFILKLKPRPNLVILEDGPILYAGHKAYDFKVNANPEQTPQSPSIVRVTLDPGEAKVVLGWKSGQSPPFIEVSDVQDLVSLESSITDIEPDGFWNTTWLHFRVMFDWAWPHEEQCALLLEFEGGSQAVPPYTAQGLFSVENDLELYGNLSVKGDLQGPIEDGDWVRVKEQVTFSGPVVVYQGTTDVYPPSRICKVKICDNDDTNKTADVMRGRSIYFTMIADDASDPDELYTITLLEYPEGSAPPPGLEFHVPVDGDAPMFRYWVPGDMDWQTTNRVLISITADDFGTSGVDASSLEYGTSLGTTMDYSEWSRVGLTTDPDGQVVDGIVKLTLWESDQNYIRWRVRDLVGNERIIENLQIRVDSRHIVFSHAVPSSINWNNELNVECGVTIADMGSSVIDVSTIEYRVSHYNLSAYGDWHDWYEGTTLDSKEVEVRMVMRLSESANIHVQWRAGILGDDEHWVSNHYRVQVDITSIRFTDFEPREDDVQYDRLVNCSVMVTDKLGGSGVDLSTLEYRFGLADDVLSNWVSAGLKGLTFGDRIYVEINLSESLENRVQFRCYDVAGNGPTKSPEYRVQTVPFGFQFIGVLPKASEKQPNKRVRVQVGVKDIVVGLNTSTMAYRFSTEGKEALGYWIPVEVTIDGDLYRSEPRVTFERGVDNYIQFRAEDLMGRERRTDILQIWVNRVPIAVIDLPVENGSYFTDDLVQLSGEGSSDPDGDELNYTWFVEGSNEPIAYGKRANTTLIEGKYNLTLVVKDRTGVEDRMQVLVIVERLPYIPVEEKDGDLMLLILFLAAVLLASIGISYMVQRLRGQRESKKP
jgi:hypothetical protein